MPRRKKSDEGIMDITRMAEDLGVSKTTVSRALSGNGRVSEATRQRVVDYAREKNYVPNMMLRWCFRASFLTSRVNSCAKLSPPSAM